MPGTHDTIIANAAKASLGLLGFTVMLAASQSVAAEPPPVVVRCKFEKLPPIKLVFPSQGGGTMQVGTAKPVKAFVGSNLVTAEYGAQEMTFSLRLPSSVTISAPGQNAKTYNGRCTSSLRQE
jgi:hypothetical protein